MSAVAAATLAAGLSVAGLVMGKAVRDTLFLATFPAPYLPYFFLGTGVLSGAAVSAYTHLNRVFSPQRVVPALAGLSAVLLPLLWVGARTGAPWVIALLYAWTTISSTFLLSGFWAVFGERFDPRAARKLFGTVGMATTVGGVVGGVGSHFLLRVIGTEALLLPLAGIELLTALAVYKLAPPKGEVFSVPEAEVTAPDAPAIEGAASVAPKAPRVGLRGGMLDIIETPYLRSIMLFAAGLTVAGTLCDYVLKDAASRALTSKQELAEFFSLFHGTVSAVTLGVQVLLCGPLVARKGLIAALVALPLWLLAGATTMLAAPVLVIAAALRGGENAVRNSFYRAGYELLFVPLPPAQKRVTKPILDALIERIADGIGAGIILVLVTAVGLPAKALLVVVFGIGAVALVMASRVRRGYVDTLSTSLMQRSLELEEVADAAGDDATTREALRSTLQAASSDKLRETMRKSHAGLSLIRSLSMAAPESPRDARKRPPLGARKTATGASKRGVSDEDPALGLIRQMMSADASAARVAIGEWDGRDRRAVPFLVRLLARDDLHRDVEAALARAGDRIAGALADHLLDPDEELSARRRIPRVLAVCGSDRAVRALVDGLADQRFDVRYQCAVALERLHLSSERRPPPERAWAAIREEVKKSRPMWEAERLLEEPEATEDPLLAVAVQRRGAHSLRHVFRLLGLVLDDPKTLEVSYKAVHANEPQFRAVGLEYLENVLPADVKDALWPLIGDDESPQSRRLGRSLAEVMADLLASGGPVLSPPEATLNERLAEAAAGLSLPPAPPPSGGGAEGSDEPSRR